MGCTRSRSRPQVCNFVGEATRLGEWAPIRGFSLLVHALMEGMGIVARGVSVHEPDERGLLVDCIRALVLCVCMRVRWGGGRR